MLKVMMVSKRLLGIYYVLVHHTFDFVNIFMLMISINFKYVELAYIIQDNTLGRMETHIDKLFYYHENSS